MVRLYLAASIMLLLAGCNKEPPTGFFAARADPSVTGMSKYPVAIHPNRIGFYPADTKSGGGHFYDDVLEYRVWFHPENGAQHLDGGKEYFIAFAEYEKARVFASGAAGAEEPLVLVRQVEWIDEPEKGHYVHEKSRRIMERQVKRLASSKRGPGSIEEFLKNPSTEPK